MSERSAARRIDSAGPDELARLLVSASGEEEAAVRNYLGANRFEEMRNLALEQPRASERKGNVIVTHGIMGSHLSRAEPGGGFDRFWLDPLHIALRSLEVLRLNDVGTSGYDPGSNIVPTGLLNRVYGKQMLALNKNWNVRPFCFDWRKDLNESADELLEEMTRHFGTDTPVHIVAHSMGGLVARTFMVKHRQRWESMWDSKSNGRTGGRLVMLGTPNHGSFVIPLLINGIGMMIRVVAAASLRHNMEELLKITNSFEGTYQMLPSPCAMPEMDKLYYSKTYADLSVPQNIPQGRLDRAREHHELLRDAVDERRMIYVAGYGRHTASGILDFSELHSGEAGYQWTKRDGDGTVPHNLGFLATPSGQRIRTYFVDETHMQLPLNPLVNLALGGLLETGTTDYLQEEMPLASPGDVFGDDAVAVATLPEARATTENRAQTLAEEIRAGSASPAGEAPLTPEEHELQRLLIASI